MEEKKVSKSVLKRLPGYLAYLKNMPENAPAHISATALANALGMGEVQVRKDLAMVSDGGRPKIGYLRETLIDDIEQFLGYDNTTDAVRHLAAQLIWISAVMMPFGSYLNATYFTLRSGGQTFVTFLFDSCFTWAVSVPLAYGLSRFTGLNIVAIYLLVNGMDIVKCAIGFVLVKKGIWVKNIVKE